MTTWTLAAVGDLLFEHPPAPGNAAFGLLAEADLAFANLEMPLSSRGHPADKPSVVRGDPAHAQCLAEMGLDVVSVANNHAADYGTDALLDTIEVVRANGIGVVGAGCDLQAAITPWYSQVDSTRIAVLAFASTLPPGFCASPLRPGVAPIRVNVSFVVDPVIHDEQPGSSPWVATAPYAEDVERACAAITEARDTADVVVVSLHWGLTPGWTPAFQGPLAEYQRPLAHKLVDAGASVILGHHPHILHGIENYRGRPILYSMGHLIFHALAPERPLTFGHPGPAYDTASMLGPELLDTGVFMLRFDGGHPRSVEVFPCALDGAGEAHPAAGDRGTQILAQLQAASKALDTTLSVGNGRAIVEVA